MYCNLQNCQTTWFYSRNLSLWFIALRATHIVSAILQPMHLTCKSAFTYFLHLKAILSSIGYNLQNLADTTIGHIPHWSRLFRRISWLFWCNFVISHSKEILLPCLTRKTIHPIITHYMGFGRCHTEWWIGWYYLNSIVNPLNQALMHSKWNVTIGMYPIPTQQQTIWTFAINNEESSGKSLTANCQINT